MPLRRVIEIFNAKYDKANLPAIVRDNCSHLTPLQREKPLSLLLEYESLFDGTLGDWNRPPVSIELKEGAIPYHGRPYPIPQIHKATLMQEINRLVDIGAMKRQSSSQWASPTFIIPEKDMTGVLSPIFESLINGSSKDHIRSQKSVPHCRSLKASPCNGFRPKHGLLRH